MQNDIFTRDKSGFPVSSKEPEFAKIRAIQRKSWQIIAELNSTYHTEEETRELMRQLIGSEVDESVTVLPPFYTDYGRNIVFGKDVFVNTNCTFMDRGGITIGDGTLIGPNVNMTTLNHDHDPLRRHITYCKPIHVGKNVWIGMAATILPGITIGDGAIVAAGAVVTKDVPSMAVVAGVPAKIVEWVEQKQAREDAS